MIHINVFLHYKLLEHRASVIHWPYLPPNLWNKGFVCVADRGLLWMSGAHMRESQERRQRTIRQQSFHETHTNITLGRLWLEVERVVL